MKNIPKVMRTKEGNVSRGVTQMKKNEATSPKKLRPKKIK